DRCCITPGGKLRACPAPTRVNCYTSCNQLLHAGTNCASASPHTLDGTSLFWNHSRDATACRANRMVCGVDALQQLWRYPQTTRYTRHRIEIAAEQAAWCQRRMGFHVAGMLIICSRRVRHPR